MTNKQSDIICSVIFLIFGGAMLYFSLGIKKMIETDVGSGYVPAFIAICILVTAAAKLILTVLNKKPSAYQKVKFDNDLIGGVGTIALMAFYVLAMEPVGFLLSSMVYLFAQILLMSNKTNRKPILFAIISIALPLAVDILFVFVIKMPLPKGILGF